MPKQQSAKRSRNVSGSDKPTLYIYVETPAPQMANAPLTFPTIWKCESDGTRICVLTKRMLVLSKTFNVIELTSSPELVVSANELPQPEIVPLEIFDIGGLEFTQDDLDFLLNFKEQPTVEPSETLSQIFEFIETQIPSTLLEQIINCPYGIL